RGGKFQVPSLSTCKGPAAPTSAGPFRCARRAAFRPWERAPPASVYSSPMENTHMKRKLPCIFALSPTGAGALALAAGALVALGATAAGQQAATAGRAPAAPVTAPALLPAAANDDLLLTGDLTGFSED